MLPLDFLKPGGQSAASWLNRSPSTASENKAEKVSIIIGTCEPARGTPAELYLRRRGITASLPDSIRYRPNAFGRYGALVALAVDTLGKVLAVQQIYITKEGEKAPLKAVKRTNKACEGWSSKAAVRFPGQAPIVLAEGVETALSVWQATGRETWACLGIANIARASRRRRGDNRP